MRGGSESHKRHKRSMQQLKATDVTTLPFLGGPRNDRTKDYPVGNRWSVTSTNKKTKAMKRYIVSKER